MRLVNAVDVEVGDYIDKVGEVTAREVIEDGATVALHVAWQHHRIVELHALAPVWLT